MRQLLIALEKNLQRGGTLAFFPSSYEDCIQAEWKKIGPRTSSFTRANHIPKTHKKTPMAATVTQPRAPTTEKKETEGRQQKNLSRDDSPPWTGM
ncbi:hypothetical protein OESDEN_02278 [Oesophagostomum dentatum]|uniref:Uncharacterized protein n=1 Tax=Oesophagostomum dentatum TaxID=61180 RepID=A0A0B1TQS9_OESDE|nr:hypothetical protein OESDEN_02278 [Oesophagostomum dentatum]